MIEFLLDYKCPHSQIDLGNILLQQKHSIEQH